MDTEVEENSGPEECFTASENPVEGYNSSYDHHTKLEMVKLLGEMDADIQDEEWIQIHKQKRKLPGLKSEIRRLQKTLRFSQDPPKYTRGISSAEEDAGNQTPPPQPRRERRRPFMEFDEARKMNCLAGCCSLSNASLLLMFIVGPLIQIYEECPSDQSSFPTAFWYLLLFLLLALYGKFIWFFYAITVSLNLLIYIGCVVSVMISVMFVGMLIAETVYVAEESDAIFGGYYTDNQTVIPCELNLYSTPILLVSGYVYFVYFCIWTVCGFVVVLLG